MEYLLGIDVGTTAVKSLLIDNDGNRMIKSMVEYALLLPRPGWAEQDPEELWRAVVSSVDGVLEQFDGDRSRIRALALSTQRDTLICLDREGRPARNAITWMDARSAPQCERLARDFGEARVYETTGVTVSPIWTFAFLLWLREEEPDVFEKSACFGLVHDFVLHRLGAPRHVLDVSNACQTMLFNLRRGVWDEELLRYGGLTAQRLPELVEPGTAVGTLCKDLRRRWGLGEVLLVSGGGDQQCAALGAGAVRVGDAEIGIGTAANLLAVCGQPIADPGRRMICHRAALPGGWVLEGAMLAAGKLVEWMRSELYGGAPLREIDTDIDTHSSPGAGGLVLLAHFEGAASPYWNPKATGAVLGLTLSTRRADLGRAVLEGVSAEVARNVGLLRDFDLQPRRLLVSGGAARSAVWMQLLADLCGIPVAVPLETDCAALGAALLAGKGAGCFPDAAAAAERVCRTARAFMPRTELAWLYGELLARGNRLYEAVCGAELYRGPNRQGNDEIGL